MLELEFKSQQIHVKSPFKFSFCIKFAKDKENLKKFRSHN